MRIFAFETSAKAVSVALLTDGVLTAERYQNDGQTHSRTLLKLAADLLEDCGLVPAELDLVAWANGPGSFTGVRIGAAAAKGLCWGLELPCAAVSTLEAMARTAVDLDGVLCCCMDARRSQVYNALFRAREGRLERLREDRAISIPDLAADLAGFDEPIRLLGDGAALVYETLTNPPAAAHSVRHEPVPEGRTAESRPYRLVLVSETRRQQRAVGVALAAWAAAREGRLDDPGATAPNYLRLSQAERERLAREQTNGTRTP